MTAGIGDTALREAIREAILHLEQSAAEASLTLRSVEARDPELRRLLADIAQAVRKIEFDCMAMRRWVR